MKFMFMCFLSHFVSAQQNELELTIFMIRVQDSPPKKGTTGTDIIGLFCSNIVLNSNMFFMFLSQIHFFSSLAPTWWLLQKEYDQVWSYKYLLQF